MKLNSLENARLARDAGIEAMDALSFLVEELVPKLQEPDKKELRLAVAKSMSTILDNIVNPVLREYPELDVDEDSWGDIAAARGRARLLGDVSSSGQP
jgi:hypothetical protein